jgi:NADH dehydrogenase
MTINTDPQAETATTPARRHHVVIIGSGFGGLFAAKRLGREPVDVTVITRTPYHLFQPLLYQVTTGILSEGEVAPTLREVLKRHNNIRVILGDVTDIDIDRKAVTSTAAGYTTVTGYDSLIVAAGAGQSYFGNDHFAQHAPCMKTIDDALALRGRIFGAFEMAELDDDPRRRKAWMTFVVVGGGPTGVEMAGQLIELSRRSMRRNFTRIDPCTARVVLLEAGPALLPAYGARLSQRTRQSLEHAGVEVHLSTPVVDIDADTVQARHADGTTLTIPAYTKIWAAGVSASPLGRIVSQATGAPLTRTGQIQVRPDCSLPGHPEVFVVGDMMRHGTMPGVAQVAIQSATFAAEQIARRVHGRQPREAFHYLDKGMIATISRFKAVAVVGPLRLSGLLAWLLWLAVHLVYLVGFKNRVTVLLHWAVTFIGRSRSERTAPKAQLTGHAPRAETEGPALKAA